MVNTEPKGDLNRGPGSIYNIPGISSDGSGAKMYKNVKTTYEQHLKWVKEDEEKREAEKVKYNAR